MANKITILRRVVQLLAAFFILYGVFIWAITPAEVPGLPKIEAGYPRTTIYGHDRLLWVSGKESVLDIYLPVLACRFIANGGCLGLAGCTLSPKILPGRLL